MVGTLPQLFDIAECYEFSTTKKRGSMDAWLFSQWKDYQTLQLSKVYCWIRSTKHTLRGETAWTNSMKNYSPIWGKWNIAIEAMTHSKAIMIKLKSRKVSDQAWGTEMRHPKSPTRYLIYKGNKIRSIYVVQMMNKTQQKILNGVGW